MYEPAMRYMIDHYINAEESKKISAFDDLSLVELLVRDGEKAIDCLPENIKKSENAVAETIENNLRRLIIEANPTNPKYFEEMSELLTLLIEERRSEARNYQSYLAKIVELSKRIKKPTGNYPSNIDTQGKRALYDNLKKDEELATKVDSIIHHIKEDDWIGNFLKEKAVKKSIRPILASLSDDEFNVIFEIIKNQPQYR